MATTNTYTSAYTRIELLKLQLKIALRRTTDITKSQLQKIDTAVQRQWISKVVIFGVDTRKLCRAQLILEIDWSEYGFKMSQGKATVVIDERWYDKTAIELDEAIELFNRFISTNSLTTKWHYSHPSNIDIDMVCRELGWKRTKKIKWATSSRQAWSSKIPELPELRVGCYLAE